ncbi:MULTISPECIES: TonB-dependent receptor [Mesonia]|uniref:TonB-dependent receptor n=1 Tax=Mesonia oceanica TaxID=2687242 RepID=A0AC61Y322_9FLAO|nr:MULTISPECIES: TonB-dependent receptor [Mesonia]MAN28616.1 TonB-dependent receptor [Mesonia sp.]MAQ41297.1 TonB-dependent receptor [Mesonia sp.]MBJ97396.1 TonB-dependent receptor [Flavobacteriaceae bacterium]VVU98870.1 putative TonB-dependent receptor [Mesonia oceanica]|tara:strand:- start:63818 stop:66205 length:2388 start_codon:yes stop_codon:yes gene_type:complete
MKTLSLVFIFILANLSLSAQNCDHTLKGKIVDDHTGEPLINAVIEIIDSDIEVYSDFYGNFEIPNLCDGKIELKITHPECQDLIYPVLIEGDTFEEIKLEHHWKELQQVLLHGKTVETSVLNREIVNKNYIEKEYTGSLSTSLEKLPGVNAMEVGSGISKPIIRGLGLNRVVVSENGINQAGQQWGADHGLELDALSVEKLEVIKGVSAIEYGSDAIGGVLKIDNDQAPMDEGISGSAMTIAKSVNNTLGGSFNLNYKSNKFFAKARLTGLSYADYKLPADTINYLNFNLPVYDEELKNTAGKELDWYFQAGYLGDNFKSTVSVSNVYQKSGFFPGAHGIPSVGRVQPDGDRRNIDFPYQRVNHFKLINNNTFFVNDNAKLIVNLGYQKNHRQEWSLFHTHYGNQAPPEKNPNLELDFNLETYDVKVKWEQKFSAQHTTNLGLEGRWQENDIAGFNFLLPQYDAQNYAAFLTHEYKVSNTTLWSLGIRYDFGKVHLNQFNDNYLYDYLIQNGESEETANNYAERSPNLNRDFGNLNVMFGGLFNWNKWTLNANIGTNFRLPTPIELGANGIHHGSFRHEQGDPDLDPEKGYVGDVELTYEENSFIASVNPYIYYFDNYIFLQPTKTFSLLPHSGQLYRYSQSRALLSGVEVSLQKTFFDQLKTQVVAEYLYNQQLTSDSSRDYPLPFTPANNLFAEVGYTFNTQHLILKETEIYANTRMTMEQDRIAQGEMITPGYALFGLGVKKGFNLFKKQSTVHLQVSNLFNKKYFKHTSFYRRLEIPELSRNIQLTLQVPF